MYRWSVCPGSVRLSATVSASTPSKYAEEGTTAHEIAAHYLLKREWLPSAAIETKEAVQVYVDAIDKDLNEDRAELFIEQAFDLSRLYPGLYGTGDAALYYPKTKFLRSYDYKHGAGIPVEVVSSQGKKNPQLQYYALGMMMSLGYEVEEIELVIVQPRCPHPQGPVRRVRMDATELFDFALELVAAAKATEEVSAPLVPGTHCRFCPAVGVCSATHDKAVALAKTEFTAVTYDPKKLAAALDWIPKLEAWISGVRDFAYAEAQHGRTPPGWKLVQKRATRKWRQGVDENTLAMCLNLRAEALVEKSLLSPAALEKQLSKAQIKELGDFTESVSSGVALAPESDKRPAVKNDPSSEFSAVPTT